MFVQNPKLSGSNLIDCIPIGGRCPNNCRPCYYNSGDFYVNPTESAIPTLYETEGKIVRVNSGGDSSTDFKDVVDLTQVYRDKFYNTSQPFYLTEFPAPVIFTCNPHQDEGWFYAVNSKNLMAVRIRVATWNLNSVDKAVAYYCNQQVPVILTFLYFSDSDKELIQHPENYDLYKHIENNRWMIKPSVWGRIVNRYPFYNVMTCGTPKSAMCADCGNCESLYERAMSIYYGKED